MNVMLTIVLGSVLLGTIAAVALAAGFVRHRLRRWADATILSFGLPTRMDDAEQASELKDVPRDTVRSRKRVRELAATH